MAHRSEYHQPTDAHANRDRATAAAAASEAFSQEALDFAGTGQRNSPTRIEAPPGTLGATPSCLFADGGSDRKPEAAPKPEAPRNDVIRTLTYKDGTTISEHANGDSIKTSPEGSKVMTRKDGTMIFQDRGGKVNMVIAGDGSITQIDHKKGTTTIEYPDGRVIIEEKNGKMTRLNRGFLRTVKSTSR